VSLPTRLYRLRYQVPEREAAEPDVGYPGGSIIEGEWYEVTPRYYVTAAGLRKKIASVESHGGRVLSIEQATLDWTAPDGHGKP
jgi:hypothetical protein